MMVTVLFLRAERERFASSMDSCCVCCGVGYFERESERESERERESNMGGYSGRLSYLK